MQVFLGHSPLQGLREVGGFGQPLHQLYPQIHAVLTAELGDAARLLAEPVADRTTNRLDWYTEGDPDEKPLPLNDLPGEQRDTIIKQITQTLDRGHALADRYCTAADPSHVQLGAMLKAVLRTPDPANVFLVNGQPVMIGWGFTTDEPWQITAGARKPLAATLATAPLATPISRDTPVSPKVTPDAVPAVQLPDITPSTRTAPHVISPAPSTHNLQNDPDAPMMPPSPPFERTPLPLSTDPNRTGGCRLCWVIVIIVALLCGLVALGWALQHPVFTASVRALAPSATPEDQRLRNQLAATSAELNTLRRQCGLPATAQTTVNPIPPPTATLTTVAPPMQSPTNTPYQPADRPHQSLEQALSDPQTPPTTSNLRTPPPPPTKVEPTPAERQAFTDRMTATGAITGEITTTLLWDTAADLDLVIRCPSGQSLDYNNPKICGGSLDVDANTVRTSLKDQPVENAFWPKGKATPGDYAVVVRYMPRKDEPTPSTTPFQVRIVRAGKETVFKGTVAPGQTTSVTTFTVER